MTRDSKWRARRLHHVAEDSPLHALGRMTTQGLAVFATRPLAALRRMAWTLFGQRWQEPERPIARMVGVVEDGPGLRVDWQSITYLCMCCAQPIRGSEFVETRSGLRRHVTCPPASTWGDERLDRLWDEIQQTPKDGAA